MRIGREDRWNVDIFLVSGFGSSLMPRSTKEVHAWKNLSAGLTVLGGTDFCAHGINANGDLFSSPALMAPGATGLYLPHQDGIIKMAYRTHRSIMREHSS